MEVFLLIYSFSWGCWECGDTEKSDQGVYSSKENAETMIDYLVKNNNFDRDRFEIKIFKLDSMLSIIKAS